MSTKTQLSFKFWEHEVMRYMRTIEKKINKKISFSSSHLHFLAKEL